MSESDPRHGMETGEKVNMQTVFCLPWHTRTHRKYGSLTTIDTYQYRWHTIGAKQRAASNVTDDNNNNNGYGPTDDGGDDGDNTEQLQLIWHAKRFCSQLEYNGDRAIAQNRRNEC